MKRQHLFATLTVAFLTGSLLLPAPASAGGYHDRGRADDRCQHRCERRHDRWEHDRWENARHAPRPHRHQHRRDIDDSVFLTAPPRRAAVKLFPPLPRRGSGLTIIYRGHLD